MTSATGRVDVSREYAKQNLWFLNEMGISPGLPRKMGDRLPFMKNAGLQLRSNGGDVSTRES